jgi:hypothetical protein
MIIKLTLIGLVLVLIGVIAMSYYVNKEGFDDISNGYFSGLSNDLGSAMNTISTDVGSAMNTVSTDVSSAVGVATGNGNISTQGVNDSTPAPNGSSVSMPPQQDGTSTIPVRTDVVPQVNISGSGYDAMNLQQRAELLKDIQKVVRNEVLASRSTTPVLNGNGNGNGSDSTAQGKEYSESCYKDTEYRCPKNPDGSCPPIPDMSQYIKKDEIPCWGCSLDY